MVPKSFALSGMMLFLVPAWKPQKLSTTGRSGRISRLTTVWAAVMIWAPIATGSTHSCGRAPWPPLPRTVISNPFTPAFDVSESCI